MKGLCFQVSLSLIMVVLSLLLVFTKNLHGFQIFCYYFINSFCIICSISVTKLYFVSYFYCLSLMTNTAIMSINNIHFRAGVII